MAPFSVSAVSPRHLVFVLIACIISIHYLVFVVLRPDTNIIDRVATNLVDQVSSTSSLTVLSPGRHENSSNHTSSSPPFQERANATFVFLCRNNDVNGVVSSIQQMEDRFNRRYHYPWVLLNEEPFTEEFKERVKVLTDAPVHFGLIQPEHWYQPEWIDEDLARRGRLRMMEQGVIYGGSVPYRNMCRFNSGFFFHHELLKPYRYYWRVEPEVKFFCNLDYDPFKFMEEHNKTYAFTISLVEWEQTIPTLWQHVKDFVRDYPQYLSKDNALRFLSEDGGNSYNLCHFWSNFEIADMDFWRGEAYQKFFEYLDSTGGFYYERWGDAPVHSIAAALFSRKDQIHFFQDIGYRHDSIERCPSGQDWSKGRCSCDYRQTFDNHINSCLRKYTSLFM